MKRFKSPRQVQRFLSAPDQINNLFHLHRDHLPAVEYRAVRAQTFARWAEITGAKAAAGIRSSSELPRFSVPFELNLTVPPRPRRPAPVRRAGRAGRVLVRALETVRGLAALV